MHAEPPVPDPYAADSGELYCVERREGRELRHDAEPGTTAWQRAAVSVVAMLPIDWLL